MKSIIFWKIKRSTALLLFIVLFCLTILYYANRCEPYGQNILVQPKAQSTAKSNFGVISRSEETLSLVQFGSLHDEYCIFPHYFGIRDINQTLDIGNLSLITQASVNLAHFLLDNAESWNGPISAAIFIDYRRADIQNAIFQLKILFFCFKEINSKVAGHLVIARSSLSNCRLEFRPQVINCRNYPRVELISKISNFPPPLTFHPCNVARNTARNYSYTPYLFINDIENIALPKTFVNLVSPLLDIELAKGKKNVLVMRRFEIAANYSLPVDKDELKVLLEAKRACIFHQYACPTCHDLPGLKGWLIHPKNATSASVTDALQYRQRGWEPGYISRNDIPFHDESLIPRHKDNQHLVGTYLYYRVIPTIIW